MKKTKLNKFLSFPCLFTYKIIGMANPKLIDQIVKIVQHNIPGDYLPQVRSSRHGKYNSVSIIIMADNIEKIELLYEELSKIDMVYMVL